MLRTTWLLIFIWCTILSSGIGSAANDAGISPLDYPNLVAASNQQNYYTPNRGSSERKAIMDAARIPVSRDIGQRVIFVVDVLRSDGQMVFLQGVPHQSNGTPLDWTKTPFREDWLNDMMSDVVMVLLSRNGTRWTVLDYAIGPTDVYWYGWVQRYNLPEAFFFPGN